MVPRRRPGQGRGRCGLATCPHHATDSARLAPYLCARMPSGAQTGHLGIGLGIGPGPMFPSVRTGVQTALTCVPLKKGQSSRQGSGSRGPPPEPHSRC